MVSVYIKEQCLLAKEIVFFVNRYHDSVIFFKLYLFISQRLQNKLCTLYQSFSLTLRSAFVWSSCGRKPEYPEQAYLSDLVTTWPSHMPTCICKRKRLYMSPSINGNKLYIYNYFLFSSTLIRIRVIINIISMCIRHHNSIGYFVSSHLKVTFDNWYNIASGALLRV